MNYLPNFLSSYTTNNPMAMAPQPQYTPQTQYIPKPSWASNMNNMGNNMMSGMNNMGNNMSTSMNNAYLNARMGITNASQNKTLITGALVFFTIAFIILLFFVVLSFANPSMIGFTDGSSNLIVGKIMFIISTIVSFGMTILLLVRMRKLNNQSNVMPVIPNI